MSPETGSIAFDNLAFLDGSVLKNTFRRPLNQPIG